MTTALNVIERAMRLISAIGTGETASGAEAIDGLNALNSMLDSWSTEGLTVFASLDQEFSWASGATKTLGPTGDLVGTRPIELLPSYFVSGGTSYPLTPISKAEYDAIPDKTLTGLPSVVYVNATMPDVEVTLHPAPDTSITVHFVSKEPLSQLTLAEEISLPPGYQRALEYNLACELAPEYGREPSTTTLRTAFNSKRNLQRRNVVIEQLTNEVGSSGAWDIRAGA